MKKIFPLVIILFGISFLSYLIYGIYRQDQHHERAKLESAMNILEIELNFILENRFFVSEALKSFFITNPDFDENEFSQFAQMLMKGHPPVRALQFANADTKVVLVYPPKGNEITIFDPMVLIDDAERSVFVKKAIKSRSSTLQPPFQLRQGGVGMVLRNPLFSNNQFMGFAIVVLDVEAIIQEVYSLHDFGEYIAGFYSEKGALFYGKAVSDPGSLCREVPVVDNFWTICMKPLEPPSNSRIILLFILGTLVIFTLAAIFYILLRQKERLNQLVAQKTTGLLNRNQALQEEVEKRRESEETIYKLLDEKEILLKEVHHRLKNNILSIRSMLSLQSRHLKDGHEKETIQTVMLKLNSLQELYRSLLNTENYSQLAADVYINNLITALKDTLSLPGELEIDVKVDHLNCNARCLFSIGIIINELITNAVKYAFPAGVAGKIRVSLIYSDSALELTIRDDGQGPKGKSDSDHGERKPGFGITLVNMLVEQLSATLERHTSQGYEYIIRIPESVAMDDSIKRKAGETQSFSG